MKSRSIILTLFIIMFITACANISNAGPFDTSSDDFTSSLIITGYEEDESFGEPASLALDDKTGAICITDTKAGFADIFNIQGAARNRYGASYGLKSPVGTVIDKNGDIIISDTSCSPLKIISADGIAKTLDLPCDEGDQPPKPGRMAFDRNGSLYVIDTANSRICIFDKDRKPLFKFGRKGNKRGEFTAVQDVAVDRQGRIYITDLEGSPVQVFDKKGKYLYKIGFNGMGEEDISCASAIFIDQNDQIWVVDRGQHALKVFDRSGTFLRQFGTYGTGQGSLFQPVDADMDRFGRVYVLEAGARRLQVFMLRKPFERFTPGSI